MGVRKTNKLVREAGKVLEENSEAIAVSLGNHAKEGHIQSTKLLLELADRSTEEEGEEPSRPLRDWAGEVAAEPEWQGEMSEEAAETGAGGREPEG
jgi:hypothetical protein